MVSIRTRRNAVEGGKLKIRKGLRRKSTEKMDHTFERFCGEKVGAGGWKEKKRKG